MRMRSVHLVGLLLWRGGHALFWAATLWYGARLFLRYFQVPREIEIGLGLIIAGVAMVLISLIAERIRDAKMEGDLLDP